MTPGNRQQTNLSTLTGRILEGRLRGAHKAIKKLLESCFKKYLAQVSSKEISDEKINLIIIV